MVVYIINQYATTPEVGSGTRHYYIAKELALLGHQVFLITANFTHLMHKSVDLKNHVNKKSSNGVNHIYLKTFEYRNSSDLRRILNWLIFSWKVSRLLKYIKKKPNIVIVSSPSPFSFLGASSLAKKSQSKIIYDIRDIWPLSIIELGEISSKNLLIKILQWVEKKAYKDSNNITSTIPFLNEHIKALGINKNKFSYLPNGFDRSELLNKEKLKPTISRRIPREKFVVGYIGSIGLANALGILLDAAKLLNENKSIVFVLVGKGAELNKLKLQANSLKLSNITFINQVAKKQVQSIIELFDVCYIGWLNKSIYKYGISPQKIPEYLFSEKPIIHSYSGRRCPIKVAKAGISVPAENPVAIKNAILKLKGMGSHKREKLGKNGKSYTNKNYDYKMISKKLESIF